MSVPVARTETRGAGRDPELTQVKQARTLEKAVNPLLALGYLLQVWRLIAKTKGVLEHK